MNNQNNEGLNNTSLGGNSTPNTSEVPVAPVTPVTSNVTNNPLPKIPNPGTLNNEPVVPVNPSIPTPGPINADPVVPVEPVTPPSAEVNPVVANDNSYQATPNNGTINENPVAVNESNMPINQNVIPGLEVPNNPIPSSDVPEQMTKQKKEKKPMNKTLFFLLIIILIGAVGAGVYYYLNMGKSGYVTPKTVQVNLGIEPSSNIADYATFNGIDSSTCTLDNSKIDSQNAGEYEYTITCGTSNYSGKAYVIDNAGPEVETKEVHVALNEEVKAEDFVVTCSKENCSYSFAKDIVIEDLTKEEGTYELEIIILDEDENSSTVSVVLVVSTGSLAAYYDAESTEETLEDYEGNMTIIDRFPIDESNEFMEPAKRIYNYTFTDKTEFESVKEEYEGADSFNDVNGEITFNDDENMLILTAPLTTETLDLEYDGEFPVEYRSIRDYYEAMGYKSKVWDPSEE